MPKILPKHADYPYRYATSMSSVPFEYLLTMYGYHMCYVPYLLIMNRYTRVVFTTYDI